MSKVAGASWAIELTYVCRCGVHYRARRWRWIDREAMEDEAERARREGPLRGRCPSCATPATGHTDWVELEPSHDRATMVLGEHQRHELVEKLSAFLDEVSKRVAAGELERAAPWLLRPMWRFVGEGAVTGIHQVAHLVPEDEREDTARRHAPSRPRQRSPNAGIPKVVGGQSWPQETASNTTAETNVAMLIMDHATDDEEVVTITLDLDPADRALWGQAALQVRPIHLRGHGYPLIGVRLVASYLGRMALIDGLVDVGSEDASAVFASLSRRFRVQLILGGSTEPHSSVIRREVSAPDLERNAALAFESGRASLARGEYPREAFVRGLESLRDTPLEERLRGAEHTLVGGAYRHLISPRETWLALEHLEAASDKQNLAHLLEVDGLSVDEYEAVRRRVLVASVEHGLCAPRRFWRRIIASGLAENFADYATRLARGRAAAAQDSDDLDSDQREEVWGRIAELCDLKQLEYPEELADALGVELEAERPRSRRGDTGRDRSAVGEINARDTNVGGAIGLRDQLRDASIRLRVATAALSHGGSGEAISAVLDALDEFDEEELLALMPSLAELGSAVVSGLHSKLESPRQQVRQASAILLGIAQDQGSIVPLLRLLAREETRVWFDVARAIGSLGSPALERLCALCRQSARGEQFPIEHGELLARVGRAMAEVVIADGGIDSIARDTVEVLSQSSETDISVAAGRALATLQDVSLAGAQVRGERSLPHHTQLRGFARRAYEAILVPELDILDEEVEAEIL